MQRKEGISHGKSLRWNRENEFLAGNVSDTIESSFLWEIRPMRRIE